MDEQIGINLDGLKKLREAEERKQHLLFLIEDLEKQNMLL